MAFIRNRHRTDRLRAAVWGNSLYAAEPLERRVLLSSATYKPDVMLDQIYNRRTGQFLPASSASPTGIIPVNLRKAYGVDVTMFGSVVGDGTGQTIAIVDAFDDPKIATDLAAFDTYWGISAPPSFTKVNEGGGSTLPTAASPGSSSWSVEITLDVEWAHVMAPKASILLVEATSATDSDLDAAVDTARHWPGVTAISMSFARDESSGDSIYDTHFTTPVGHVGVTFLAASGDWGNHSNGNASNITVEYPVSSPNVLGVGGTSLTAPGGTYSSETAWSGSGGGISKYKSQPAYQNGIVTQSNTFRTVPDVAMDADPNTGVSIYDSYDFGTSNPWAQYGGTSLSSPLWAGIIAMINQGRVSNGLQPLDGPTQTLPMIYSLPASDFHDITSGSNGYSAGPGYDLVTGRGSPKVNLLAPAMATALAGPIIGSLTANPAAVYLNQNFVLTAGSVTDTSGTVTGVKFYRDSNNTWNLQTGADTFLGNGVQSGSNWTLANVSTSGLAPGTYGFYAVATDSNNTTSSAPVVSLNLQNPAARGSEFHVNTYVTSAQQNQAVGMDSAGDYVIAWSSYGQDGSGNGIYAQRYNTAGAAQGAEFRVNTTTSSAQATPTVAMDSAGDFVIAWTSNNQDGSGYGIYAQRYNAAGTKQGVEFKVNTYTTSTQYHPSAAMDAAGDFVVTWASSGQDGSNYGVYAQRYNSSGAAQGAEFRVNTTTNGNQTLPVVAMDSTGDFVVTWESYGQDGSGYGIYTQRYNSAGAAQGGETQVNTYTTGDQAQPAVAMDSTGNYAITWSSYLEDGSSQGIYARRYNAAGVAQGGEFLVNTTTAQSQYASRIAMDAAGDFAITWESTNEDGSFDGIFAQRYLASGATQGGEFQVNTWTANQQDNPAVAMDTPGDFVIAWQSYNQAFNDLDVYAQRYAAYLTPTTTGLGPVAVNANAAPSVLPLTSAFADSVDSSDALAYSIVSNSKPGLLTPSIDNGSDTLTLTYAANQTGTAQIDVRATDTGGKFVDTILNVTVDPAWLATNSAASWDAGTNTLTVTGAATITANPGSDQPNISANGASAQLLIEPNGTSGGPVQVGNITLLNGAGLSLYSTATLMSNVVIVNGVLTLTGGLIDLTDGAMIVNPPSTDPTGTLEGYIRTGRNAGAWNGASGIKSSTAATDRTNAHFEISAVGIARNGSLLAKYAKFDNQTVTNSSVLLRYTAVGDFDLNGKVDDDDATVFGLFYDGGATTGHHWWEGDADWNGKIDDDDATIFGLVYGNTATAPAAAPAITSATIDASTTATVSPSSSDTPTGSTTPASAGVFSTQTIATSDSNDWLNGAKRNHGRKSLFV